MIILGDTPNYTQCRSRFRYDMLVGTIEERNQGPLGPEADGTQLGEGIQS